MTLREMIECPECGHWLSTMTLKNQVTMTAICGGCDHTEKAAITAGGAYKHPEAWHALDGIYYCSWECLASRIPLSDRPTMIAENAKPPDLEARKITIREFAEELTK